MTEPLLTTGQYRRAGRLTKMRYQRDERLPSVNVHSGATT
jgi:hypothetical protein